MVLLSAIQDFQVRTLRAVPGLLGKLRYVAFLRYKGEGFHWGLEKLYGSVVAEKAIMDSQRALITQVLRTPLADLADDLQNSAAAAQVSDSELLTYLETTGQNSLTRENFRASEKHFMSVLHTLSALAQNKMPANRQDVSPLPPPAR